MQIVIAIVTYNNESTIKDCLASILTQSQPLKILVIDNGSTDTTLKIVSSYKKVFIIRNKKNNGFAGGNNQAIAWALKNKSDYLLILNPDTYLFKNTVEKLINAACNINNQGIFGPIIYADLLKRCIWSRGGVFDKVRYCAKLITKVEREIDFISGTCLLIPQSVLQSGLTFYEKYFMYYEDLEFSLFAKKLGFAVSIVNDAEIIHFETSKHSSFAKTKNYYLARNHLLFVERNSPVYVKLHEIIRLPKTIYEHWRNNNRGALVGISDYFLRKFGTYEFSV